jgi:hypothetical protein
MLVSAILGPKGRHGIAAPVRAWVKHSGEHGALKVRHRLTLMKSWHGVSAPRASGLFQATSTTPLRAWLLHAGPSGLSTERIKRY